MARKFLVFVLLALSVGCATTSRTPTPEKGGNANDQSALTVVAEIALERGDCRKASESYLTVARRGTIELARRATEVALSCQHLPAAWQAAQRWHELAPDDQQASVIHGLVALKLHRLMVASDALGPLFQKFAAGSGERDVLDMIVFLVGESSANAVHAALEGVFKDSTLSARSHAVFGDLALEADDLASAERHARAALAIDAQSGDAMRVLAHVQVLRGEADAAIATAREAMRIDPDGSAFMMAEVLAGLDRLEQARQELERLRDDEDRQAQADQQLAALALRAGDLAEAQTRLVALASSGNATDRTLFQLADLAARSGDKEAALSGFQRLIESAQLAVAARLRAAAILLERDDRTGAFALLDDHAAQFPQRSFDLALGKAQILADHGELDTSLALLATALDRHPEHPAIEYQRAVLLQQHGRVDEAVKVLERSLARRPDDPSLMNTLGYTLADHNRELARAEGLIRKALQKLPDSAAVLDSLGWVRFRRGDSTHALPLLRRAYMMGYDPEIAAHLGEVLWSSGASAEARQVWAAALARNPEAPILKATIARLLPPTGT